MLSLTAFGCAGGFVGVGLSEIVLISMGFSGDRLELRAAAAAARRFLQAPESDLFLRRGYQDAGLKDERRLLLVMRFGESGLRAALTRRLLALSASSRCRCSPVFRSSVVRLLAHDMAVPAVRAQLTTEFAPDALESEVCLALGEAPPDGELAARLFALLKSICPSIQSAAAEVLGRWLGGGLAPAALFPALRADEKVFEAFCFGVAKTACGSDANSVQVPPALPAFLLEYVLDRVPSASARAAAAGAWLALHPSVVPSGFVRAMCFGHNAVACRALPLGFFSSAKLDVPLRFQDADVCVPMLLEVLTRGWPSQRLACRWLNGWVDAPGVLDGLLTKFRCGTDSSAREAGEILLGEMHRPVVRSLFLHYLRPELSVYSLQLTFACRAMEAAPELVEVRPFLLRHLNHHSDEVRAAAARALGSHVSDPEVRTRLAKGVFSPDREFSAACFSALAGAFGPAPVFSRERWNQLHKKLCGCQAVLSSDEERLEVALAAAAAASGRAADALVAGRFLARSFPSLAQLLTAGDMGAAGSRRRFCAVGRGVRGWSGPPAPPPDPPARGVETAARPVR